MPTASPRILQSTPSLSPIFPGSLSALFITLLVLMLNSGCQQSVSQSSLEPLPNRGELSPSTSAEALPEVLSNSLQVRKKKSTADWKSLDRLSKNTIHQSFLRAAAKSLQTAYPDWVAGFGPNIIYWKDGTAMNWQANISTRHFHILMSAGRLRMGTFFRKMYGSTQQEVSAGFKTVTWLPSSKKEKIKFHSENGAADALQKVSNTLDTLPHLKKYLTPIGGTFKWRKISGTERLSSHSFGISIDINTKYADYWRWAPEFKAGKPLKFRNRIPMEIVGIFEENGFVWGGRWPHYDTMHFEYRPEVKLYNEWFAQSGFLPID